MEDIDTVRARTEALAAAARFECLSFMPGGTQPAESLEASKPLDQELLERGVAVSTAYLDGVRNDPATLADAEWLTECGGEVRTIPTLPLRTVIFDRDVALLAIEPESSRLGTLQGSGAGILTALCALFDMIWTAATPSRHRSGSPRTA